MSASHNSRRRYDSVAGHYGVDLQLLLPSRRLMAQSPVFGHYGLKDVPRPGDGALRFVYASTTLPPVEFAPR